jgi:magnesium transporter
VLIKEFALGLIRGGLFGLVAGFFAWGWKGEWAWGIVVGGAMMLNMFLAGILGAVIPLGLRAIRADPALASGVFLTAATDVLGFFFLLGLGAIFVEQLT